jgi:tetratricopeptide (TPR) repeat protein
MAQELAAKLPSGDNVDLASILHCHAEYLVRKKQLVEAEELGKRALAMHRRIRPAGHAEIAFALWTLGLAQERQEKLAEAEDSYREAMDIWIRLHGSRPEMRGQTVFSDGLIRVLKAQGRDDEAADVATKYKQAGDQ